MDGENNGKPYEQMDDLGGPPLFLVQHPHTWNTIGTLRMRGGQKILCFVGSGSFRFSNPPRFQIQADS